MSADPSIQPRPSRGTVTLSFRDLDWYADHLDGIEWRGERDFLARCPAHDDGRPSCHVWEDGQGLRVHCFAGCTWSEIDAALDGSPVRPAAPKVFRQRERGRVVARYVYCDAEGEVIYLKSRFEPKDFVFLRAVAVAARTSGPVRHEAYVSWQLGLKDRDGNYIVEPVPYRLPELLEADEVWIADGEKDCDALASVGVVATCSPYGMARWRDEWSALLRDKSVIVVADRDEPGYRAARQVVESVRQFARDVRLVEAFEGKDAADHLEAALDLDDFVEVE